MSNAFVQHLTNTSYTENGCRTYKSSLDSNVDLFFRGAVEDKNNIVVDIKKAISEDYNLALKVSLYLRDVRHGQGKRDVIRALIEVLLENDNITLSKLLPYLPEVGRWKDVLEYVKSYDTNTLAVLRDMINNYEGNLLHKWLPRKGYDAKIIRELLGLTPKQYRRFCVDGSNTVEQLLCSQQFDKIQFDKLPSVAGKIYQDTFMRHCTEQYSQYIESLKKGEKKINSSTLYPHDIARNIYRKIGDIDVLNAQWKALPNYMEGTSNYNIFPIIDTSGSMLSEAYGNTYCLDVAIGLGLYLAERNQGFYNKFYCTFSDDPTFYKLEGNTISELIEDMPTDDWGYSTNIQRVFKTMLDVSVENNVPKQDIPKVILIISDMEFNEGVDGSSCFDMMKTTYNNAGYDLPLVVFWNVSSRSVSNVPVRKNEEGCVLLGGYSPIIMKDFLGMENKEELTPLSFVINTIKDKYTFVDDILSKD